MAKNLIEKITEKQINPNIPEFRVGDTVCVDCKIVEEKADVQSVSDFNEEEFHLIGEAFKTYIMCEYKGKLVIIDNFKSAGHRGHVSSKIDNITCSHTGCVNNDISLCNLAHGHDCILINNKGARANVRAGEFAGARIWPEDWIFGVTSYGYYPRKN